MYRFIWRLNYCFYKNSVAHYTSGIWGQGVRNFGFRGNLTRKHSLEYWAQFDERGTCPGDNYDFAESIKRPNYWRVHRQQYPDLLGPNSTPTLPFSIVRLKIANWISFILFVYFIIFLFTHLLNLTIRRTHLDPFIFAFRVQRFYLNYLCCLRFIRPIVCHIIYFT